MKFPETFYPLPERFITFSPLADGGEYANFPIVTRLLRPILEKAGIVMLHLEAVQGALPFTYAPAMDFRQNAHAIKQSLYHVTVGGITAHLAREYGTPVIEVKDELPEDVANAVLEWLGLEKVKIKTQFIGTHANQFQLEFIPNAGVDYNKVRTGGLLVRMDQVHNENILAELLSWRKEPVGMYVKRLPANLNGVGFLRYYLTEKYNKEELMRLAQLPLHKEIVFRGDPALLPKIRRDLRSPHDFPIIMPPLNFGYQPKETDKFITNKIILSSGNVYGSIWHAKVGIPGMENLVGRAASSPEFLESLNFFHLFEETT